MPWRTRSGFGNVAEAVHALAGRCLLGCFPNSYSISTLQRQRVHYSAWSAYVTWSITLHSSPKLTARFSHGTQISLCIGELWLKHSIGQMKAMLTLTKMHSFMSSKDLQFLRMPPVPFCKAWNHKELAAALRKNLLSSLPPKLKPSEVKWM